MFHNSGLELLDHNSAFVPYFAADDVVTMGPLWRGDVSVVQGEHVHAIFPVVSNHPNVESLAQWKSNGKSRIAQKFVLVIAAGNVLIGIAVAAMRRSSGVLMTTS